MEFVSDRLKLALNERAQATFVSGRSGGVVLRVMVAARGRRCCPAPSCGTPALQARPLGKPWFHNGLPRLVEAVLERHLLEEVEALRGDGLQVVFAEF